MGKQNPITLGSLFDGSGGFPLAGAINGAIPLWAAEIEPYPISVTRERFPQMQHLGSVTKIKGGEIPPVDIITFGSPCQDMSIAGKRAGMQHAAKGDEDTTRSGLFYEAIRIIREMREATHGEYPTFAVWENVPGAFSSNKGEDFRCVLEELAKIAEKGVAIPQPAKGKWLPAGEIVGNGFSIAWRTLDAQYWGVPQRRKRIYLVADFADGCSGKILFERESVSGDSESSEAAREGATDDAERSAGRSDRVKYLTINRSAAVYEPKSAMDENWAKSNVKDALRANASKSCHVVVCGAPIAVDGYNQTVSDKIGSLRAGKSDGDHVGIVGYDARGNGNGKTVPTLTGDHQNRVTDYTSVLVTTNKPPRRYIVRRLTPLECCRLQGFPDGWGDTALKEQLSEDEYRFWLTVRQTKESINGRKPKHYTAAQLLAWYNRLHTDSAEYKMWGNGIALPCAAFVLGGVVEAMQEA